MGGMKKQKVMRAVALGGALMALWGSAQAIEVNGGFLLSTCEAALLKPAPLTVQQDAFKSGYCAAFLDASFGALVAEAAEAKRSDTGLCPKADSDDPLLMVKIAIKYLKENPQTHSLPAEIPVRAALRKAFPCR